MFGSFQLTAAPLKILATVIFCGQLVIVGGVLLPVVQVVVEITFVTVTLKLHKAVFLKVSVAVTVTNVVPNGNALPEAVVELTFAGPVQLSSAVIVAHE